MLVQNIPIKILELKNYIIAELHGEQVRANRGILNTVVNFYLFGKSMRLYIDNVSGNVYLDKKNILFIGNVSNIVSIKW